MSLLDRLRTLFYPDMDPDAEEGYGTLVADPVSALAALSPAPDPLIGQTLKARYTIQRMLGCGGVGAVYRATDLDVHNRPVVVKVLLESSSNHEWLVRKFQHESEALSLIDHPGVVKVLDRGVTSDGRPFFVMEYIKGTSLRQRAAQGDLSLREVGAIVRQIGQALGAAHDTGVVHRDLKPENIMLQTLAGGVQQVRIIDFGIAKVEDPQSASGTQGPIMAGTLLYMAPEQLEDGITSPASDLYALGVIAYELLVGQKPFQPPGPNSFALANKLITLQREGTVRAPSELRPDVPPAAENLLLSALAFDPGQRPAGTRVFGELFAEALSTGDTPLPQMAIPTMVVAPTEAATPLPIDTPRSHATLGSLEPVGGAVPLASSFYVVRSTDAEFYDAITRRDSIVLVKGARQMGKTSLLARGLQRARELGARVVVSDFQTLAEAQFASAESVYAALAEGIAEQLDLDVDLDRAFDPKRGASVSFKRFMQREAFRAVDGALVWGLDEVDRLFAYPYSSEIFGLFRSWHNARAFEPDACWSRLTLAIAYATEAHLFIRDPNQSPFNVGTRLALADFTPAQVADLNARHGAPLGDDEVARFYGLVGGHPYLVRRGLHFMASTGVGLDGFEREVESSDGPLADHLQYLTHAISLDAGLRDAIRAMLEGREVRSEESFYLLRAIGVVAGESAADMRPRCALYERYLRAWAQNRKQ
jgi:serine/threonine protein kinase